MFNIASYLEKFKSIGVSERKVKEVCKEACLALTGMSCDDSQIIYKEGIISLKVTGPLKSALFVKKEKLFASIQSKLTTPIRDIRFF